MKVGVIGAGQMGAGIAQVCAAIGNQVILCDIKQEFVEKGLGKEVDWRNTYCGSTSL